MVVSSTDAFAKLKKPRINSGAIKKAGGKIKKGANKVGGAVGSSFKIIDKGLRKAGLPSSSDIKKTLKCIKPTIKDINNLRKNPRNKAILEKLRNGPCMQELKILDEDCLGPAITAASMIPQVGPFIAGVCTQISNIDAKANAAIDRAEQAQEIAKNPGGIARSAIQSLDEDDEEDDS